MRCKHKWVIIDKTILTHPIADGIRNAQSFEGNTYGIEDRVIYVFQCENCSKVKIEEK